MDKVNWPVFADINSGLLFGNSHPNIIHHYDLLLHATDFQNEYTPDLILQLGGQITSKSLMKFIQNHSSGNYIIVTERQSRIDPTHRNTHQIVSNAAEFLDKCSMHINNKFIPTSLDKLQRASQSVEQLLTACFGEQNTITEPKIARLISQHIPENTGLFVASSMPIRYIDTYTKTNWKSIHFGANRGTSGIDGNIASATGFSDSIKQNTTLFIGDLAFLHDINSLAILTSAKQKLIIVVINNSGGGIFSLLPIADHFNYRNLEKHFANPHNFEFKFAAELFGLHYAAPTNSDDFITVYKDAFDTPHSPKEILKIIKQVCRGLKYAWEKYHK